jgi:hypothetical protein
MRTPALVASSLLALTLGAHADPDLRQALTFHASFDRSVDADFSRGEKACLVRKGKEFVPAAPSDDVRIVGRAGKFGGALHFPRKGATRPQYAGPGVLGYNDRSWSVSVSAWLRLEPDQDLEPGYCDPAQIVGDDARKGFIFLEWSKDHSPRFFRYAIRPLVEIWNPTNVGWEDIAPEKRPMVQLGGPIFSREKWTHVVFTIENGNSTTAKPAGRVFIDGAPRGAIEGWDLRFGWDPAKVALVLGAAYVGHIDDVAVFNRALTEAEVKRLHALPKGASELHR